MQFAIVLIYNQVSGGEENPKDTMGERLAIGFAALWGLFFGTIGIMGLKDRPGPPFPPGRFQHYLCWFLVYCDCLNNYCALKHPVWKSAVRCRFSHSQALI